jgi:glycosyltransferase involved in cell wall biosynthesis
MRAKKSPLAFGALPLVSVIIPAYNRLSLLREAAESVLAQTFRGFELIVVDDGSTDGTEEYFAGHRNIIYLRTEHCGTPGRARNKGTALAGGRYLAFLDSDDLWLPEKLERQLNSLRAGGPGGAQKPRLFHTRELWLRNGKEISQAGQTHRREGDIFADSLVKCVIGPSTVLVERSFFEEQGGFREDLEIAEDYELWLRMTFAGPVAYLDEPLTVKRAGSGDQLSEKYGHIEIFRIRALRNLVERGAFAAKQEKDILARAELTRKCGIYAAGCRKRGRTAEAEEYETLAARLF